MPVIVGGAATYTAALHLMRTGAAGVLVGFGGGAASTTRASLGIHAPMATAVADVAGARRDYLDESGGRYVHVIADGGLGTSGDIVKASRSAPTPSCSASPSPARPRLPAAAGTGVRRPATELPARLPRRGRHGRRRSRRSCSARRPTPTAPRQSDGRSAALDGDDRLLGPEGVPARRGRHRARTAQLTADDGRSTGSSGTGDRRPGAAGVPADPARGHAAAALDRACWLLCLVVAGVFAWLGQWQLGRAIDTDPPPAGATEEVQPHRGRRRAGRVPARAAGRPAGRGVAGTLDPERLPRRRRPASTTASRATG